MSAPITLPASHLNALGGLRGGEGGDPAVLRKLDGSYSFVGAVEGTLRLNPRAVVVVEPSMAALLRALARQHGAKLEPGEVPTWSERDEGGGWWLSCAGRQAWLFTPHDGPHDPRITRYVPALTVGMGRLESFVAVVEWQVSR